MLKDKTETIINILRNNEVMYWTEGKNVSLGAVNVQCVFCDDHSNHLGIFPNDLKFHCWRCQESGSIVWLFRKLLHISRLQAEDLLLTGDVDFKRDALEQMEEIFNEVAGPPVEEVEKDLILPKYMELITIEMDTYRALDNYRYRRKIHLKTLMDHQCYICRAGSAMSRMIIPVIDNDEIVAYQAADLTGTANLRYDSSAVKINNYLYNYDRLEQGSRIIITEGVLDCWRVGPGAVCSFGTSLTDRQRHLILKKKPSELIFCWDEDAWWKGYETMDWFRPFVPKVNNVELPEDEDPDSLGADAVWKHIDLSLLEVA